MLTCPDPPPVTLVLDSGDDVAHTWAAMAAHHPKRGWITVHPTPATESAAVLAYDILAALGKPVPSPDFTTEHASQADTAWVAAAAWILTASVTHLILLRAHLISPRRWQHLLTLRVCTGIRLTAVCHRTTPASALIRTLDGIPHRCAEPAALWPPAACPPRRLSRPGAGRPLAGRWINLPVLGALTGSVQPTRRCRCIRTARDGQSPAGGCGYALLLPRRLPPACTPALLTPASPRRSPR